MSAASRMRSLKRRAGTAAHRGAEGVAARHDLTWCPRRLFWRKLGFEARDEALHVALAMTVTSHSSWSVWHATGGP